MEEKGHFDNEETKHLSATLVYFQKTKEERKAVGAEFPDNFLLKPEDQTQECTDDAKIRRAKGLSQDDYRLLMALPFVPGEQRLTASEPKKLPIEQIVANALNQEQPATNSRLRLEPEVAT